MLIGGFMWKQLNWLMVIIVIGSILVTKYTYAIGEIAVKYEVGSKGPGFISNGSKWDPGGTSYGSYQLALTPGTLRGFLHNGSEYADELSKYTPDTRAFNDKWRELAARDPDGFKQAQFDYIMKISFLPAREYADKLGWPDNLAINTALFSISNQHGGYKKIMNNTNIYANKNDMKDLINKFYDARAKYIKNLTNPKLVKIRANLIKNRTIDERADVLKLVEE